MATAGETDYPVMVGDEMRRIDLEVTNQLGFYRVMECVATRTADFIHYTLKRPWDSTILCVAGKGNNGGNAITCGRILAGRGFTDVRLLLAHNPEDLKGIVGEQYGLFSSFGGHVVDAEGAVAGCDVSKMLVIDGLLGTGITRSPSGAVGDMISLVNSWGAQVLSCDIPSGLDHVSGEPHEPCMRATWTLNYHVVKSGQVAAQARGHIGELWTAETNLTFTHFEGEEFGKQLQNLYRDSPFVRLGFPSNK